MTPRSLRALMVALGGLVGLPAAADTTPVNPVLNGLISHLSGSWKCSGHFANGKAISSSEVFAPVLGGRWLAEDHTDDPPFSYLAHALWGFDDAQNRLTLTVFDNFGGLRLFTSAGEVAAAYTFQTTPLLFAPARQERFVYRLTNSGYAVEYQVLDATGIWKMGDALDCVRR
jgi:hypothetical protein